MPDLLDVDPSQIVEDYLQQVRRSRTRWERKPWTIEAGRAIFSAPAELQIKVVPAALERMVREDGNLDYRTRDDRLLNLESLLTHLLARRLPFEASDLEFLLKIVADRIEDRRRRFPFESQYYSWLSKPPLPQLLDHLERHVATNGLSLNLRELLERLRSSPVKRHLGVFEDRLVGRMDLLLGQSPTVDLDTAELWAEAVCREMREMADSVRRPWMQLFSPVHTFDSPKPTKAWLAASELLLRDIGESAFQQCVERWFGLVNHPANRQLSHRSVSQLMCLVWSCSLLENAILTRSMSRLAEACFQKTDDGGLRSVRVGNACICVLGRLSGSEAVNQLTRLRQRIKFRPAQAAIDKALDAAALRTNVSREELEELTVPTYGLDGYGRLREQIGLHTANIEITGTQEIDWTWDTGTGKTQKSIPAEVRRDHADELKELKATVQEIQKMRPAQRDRIEALLRTERAWSLAVWRERYLDHPLLANLVRRLIWHFRRGDQSGLGIWHEGCLVDRKGRPIDWLTEEAEVRLWHPICFEPETVLQWRVWLDEHGVTQPFKQAHREVYLLTDAELNTATYSNRFAAHLLKQHQFKALCDQKGWKYRLELVFDGGSGRPVATLGLPQWGLAAEFWVEPAGGDQDAWTQAGAFLYVSTDQVRFCTPDGTPRPLTEVPALVLTEVMRDVDLFVGVASVGNDPAWQDSDGVVGFQDYWHSYAFGDLTASAQTRSEVLERLLPRLKIAARCRLEGKFLIVKGDLRTYKIHLGSSNILMEPNDQYLCIVPDRSGVAKGEGAPLFLPFEGDRTLSLILSKAFLLAEDKKIKDATILSQFRT
jgi:hypothetical protein